MYAIKNTRLYVLITIPKSMIKYIKIANTMVKYKIEDFGQQIF